MRSHIRTLIVIALAAGLLALFLYNVDLRGVVSQIIHASPIWLTFSLATTFISLAMRAWRWQYLLAPMGTPSFNNAFQATAVGFAASAVLPARAGEVIRPYFLSRRERRQSLSATSAFATIILERLLDMLAVLVLLASYVIFFRPTVTASNAVAYEAVKWAGATAGAGAIAVLVVLFVLAGNPARLGQTMARLGRVLPSTFAALLAQVAEKFASGLGVIRSPARLVVALVLSFPLWLVIAAGTWAAAVAFHLNVPFPGSFLLLALLVVGVALPTPGAVGGFHAMFKYGVTTFFAGSDDAAVGAAIILHLITVAPALLLGLLFAAQEGLNIAGMRQLAHQREPDGTPVKS
jgi:uncharacterized membrane protein YbhN (UPF0104 family)